jgi:hypothetical protein
VEADQVVGGLHPLYLSERVRVRVLAKEQNTPDDLREMSSLSSELIPRNAFKD